jgi:hypothetical protein
VATVANLFIRIAASSTEFEKSLKGAEAQFNKTGAKLQSVGANLTKSITLPLVAAAAGMVKVGLEFDHSMDKIRSQTGATGASLQGLGDSFRTVFASVPNEMGQVADAIGMIHSRTGQTGAGLEALATQTLNLSRITGEELGALVATTTRLFGDWSIATEKQAGAMDYLYKVSQTTGIGVERLSNLVVQFGAPLRALGFSFEEAGALMGKWEKEGVNLETLLAGLRFALGNFAKAGLEPKLALEQVQQAILGARTESEATAIAFQTFGKRAAVDMSRAIIEGRFNIDELVKSLKASKETINIAAEATLSLDDRMALLAHRVLVAAEPIANQFVGALESAVEHSGHLTSSIESLGNGIAGLPDWVKQLSFGLLAVGAAAGPASYLIGGLAKAWAGLAALMRMSGLAAILGQFGKALFELYPMIRAFGWEGFVVGMQGFTKAIFTLASASPVGFFLKLGLAVITLSKTWTEAFAVIAAAPIGGIISSWRNLREGWDRYFGSIEMPALPGASKKPKPSINAPLGPALEINQAMSLLDSQLDSTTKKYGGLGKAGETAMKGIGKATKEALEYTRAIDRELAIYTGVNMGAGGNLGGMMAQLDMLSSYGNDPRMRPGDNQYRPSLQDAANQFGMSQGALPTVDTLNVTQQVTEYAAEQMARSATETVDSIRSAFQYFTGSLSGGMAALLGGVMNSFEKAGKKEGSFLNKFLKKNPWISGAVDIGMTGWGMGAGLGEQFGKGKGAAAGAGSGALAGLLAGGPIGAVVGGLAGLFGGLFGGGKKKREEQAKMAEARGQLLDQFGGMEGLTKAAGLAGVSVATLFATDNAKTFQAELEKVTAAIEVMQKRVATTVGEIDKVMAEGGLIGKDLWASILQDKDAEEIKAKLAEVFDASVQRSAEGFTKIASNFELLKRPINEIGVLADAAFAGLLAGGASIPEAIAQMGDGLAHIQELLAKSGEGATGPLATLLNYQAITAANQGLFELLSGVDDMLTGLGNSGLLTQERFAALGLTITQAFGQLQAQGVAAGTALELMQPQLQKLWEAQQMFGLQTDAATQALIDQAVQQGIVGQNMKDVNSQILDVLKAIATVLGAEIPGALAALPGQVQTAATAFAGIAIPDIRVGIRPNWKDWDWPEQPTGPTGGTGSKSPTSSDYRPMATGGIVTRPTRALIGEAGPEAVIPLDEWREQGPSVRIDRVYGTVDKAFVESIAKTVLLGGKPATAWRGVR